MQEPTKESELVTAAELARLLGVTRGTVSNWRRRHTDFPEPVAGSESSPRFNLDEALNWMEHTGRTGQLTPTERLSLAARTQEVPEYEALAGLAVSVAGMPGDTLEALWSLDDDALTEELRDKTGLEPSASDWLAAHPGEARTLLKGIVDSSAVEALEALQGSQTRRTRTGRRITPWFARLLVDLAGVGRDPKPQSLCDPAAGSGAILSAASLAGIGRLSGQEADPDERILCKARLREEAPGAKADISESLALAAGRVPEPGFDAVVSSIPKEDADWWSAELVMDPRWTYGIPDSGDATLAWVQHALSQLRPGGRAVLALDPMRVSRPGGAAIRRELVKRGALRCVVSFPTGIGTGRGDTHVWVLEPDAATGASVLFVDTLPVAVGSSRSVDVAATVRKAVTAFFEGRKPGTGAARAVPAVDLLSERIDLVPSHHVATARDARSSQDAAREAWRLLRESAADLAGRTGPTPDLRSAEGEPGWSRAALGDLERGGAVEILRSPVAVGDAAEEIDLSEGDLVFPEVVRDPEQVVVVTDKDVPMRPRWFIVKVDADRLDPWFLAGFIRSEQSRRSATTGGTLPRLNPRKILIPLVPLEKQRAYAEVFRRADGLRRAAKMAATNAVELERQALDALTGGSLVPADATGSGTTPTRHNDNDTATVRNGGPSGGQ